MKLKLPVVRNKKNNQINISLPRRRLAKTFLKDLEKKKYIKIEILDFEG